MVETGVTTIVGASAVASAVGFAVMLQVVWAKFLPTIAFLALAFAAAVSGGISRSVNTTSSSSTFDLLQSMVGGMSIGVAVVIAPVAVGLLTSMLSSAAGLTPLIRLGRSRLIATGWERAMFQGLSLVTVCLLVSAEGFPALLVEVGRGLARESAGSWLLLSGKVAWSSAIAIGFPFIILSALVDASCGLFALRRQSSVWNTDLARSTLGVVVLLGLFFGWYRWSYLLIDLTHGALTIVNGG